MLADYILIKRVDNIFRYGTNDYGKQIRPVWDEDNIGTPEAKTFVGKPAHTFRTVHDYRVYKLAQQTPISTLRFTNWRAAIDEVLWIWQKNSNNVKDLHSHIWDAWADENGSIGKAYGYQVGKEAQYPFGKASQIDMIIYYLKNQPAFRSMVAELFKHEDLYEMGLYPCVHGLQFLVSDGKLNLFLNQRSNDIMAAGDWNVVQYSALVYMLAQVCGFDAGELAHYVGDSHIYDRHIPAMMDITLSRAVQITERLKNIDINQLNELFSTKEACKKFKAFREEILREELGYSEIIKEAEDLQLHASVKTDYPEYVKRVLSTPQYNQAMKIVDYMYDNGEAEKALGYVEARLELDKEVKDFKDFKTPLTTEEETGKYVPSDDSSFKMKDYNWKEEGKKLQTRLPIAK